MYVRLFLPFVSEQLKIGIKHQWKSWRVCFGQGHGLFGLILAELLHAVLGSAILGEYVGDESTESRSAALQPFSIPPHFCYCRQMNWWVVEQRVQNRCLYLRCRAFPVDGQVSAGRSRCQGSTGRRAGDNVAPLQRSSSDWVPSKIERLSASVGRRHPVTDRKVSLLAGSISRCGHWGTRQERSTLLLNGPGLRWLFATLLLQQPSQRASHLKSRAHDVDLSCPTFLQGMWAGLEQKGRFRCCGWLPAHVYLPCCRGGRLPTLLL